MAQLLDPHIALPRQKKRENKSTQIQDSGSQTLRNLHPKE
jgi:hypothetical protein